MLLCCSAFISNKPGHVCNVNKLGKFYPLSVLRLDHCQEYPRVRIASTFVNQETSRLRLLRREAISYIAVDNGLVQT
jgi:hypothetical protein